MGREIYTEILDENGKSVWNSLDEKYGVFCGRTDATCMVASYAMRDKSGDGYILSLSEKGTLNSLIDDLKSIQSEADKTLSRLVGRRESLAKCRDNARNMDAFNEFDVALYETSDKIANEYWNEANDVIKLSRLTVSMADRFNENAKEENSGHSYVPYWVVSE